MSKQIPLTRNKFAIIDDDDYPRVSKHKWCVTKTGTQWYALSEIDGKSTYLHRFIMNAQKGKLVDHINHDTLDCQKHNMRICTKSQNMANAPKRAQNTSGYKGVTWARTERKWRVQITVKMKAIHVGYYPTKELAARAYDSVAQKYFGEFAFLNFP